MKLALLLTLPLAITVASVSADDKTPAKVAESVAKSATTQVKDVTPTEAEQLIKGNKDVVVLDVRTPEEFQEGHIAGAKNVDFQDDKFAERLAGLDKNATYVLHCAAGGRSTRALKKMEALDFKTIYHMNGGLRAWKEAGKPVTK